MIPQLSIFAENRQGAMNQITGILQDSGINMNTLVTNDSAEFGIIRMLVDDADKAASVLSEAGYMCHIDSVAAIEISNTCGSLNSLLSALSAGYINLDYIYVTFSSLSRNPVAILHTQDLMEVEGFLASRGYQSLRRLD